jgi:hypothetical protein
VVCGGAQALTRFHLNLAWNRHVRDLFEAGFYDDYLTQKESSIQVTFFGSASGLCWNGGRMEHSVSSVSAEELVAHVQLLNERGVGFIFTYNNTRLSKKDLCDPLSNWVLAACQSGMNGVVVASECLRVHVRKHYNKYFLVASSLLGYLEQSAWERLYELYDVVVLPEDWNLDAKKLASVREPERSEVILNSTCACGCAYRMKHLEAIEDEIARSRQGLRPVGWKVPCSEAQGNGSVVRSFIRPEGLEAFIKMDYRRFKFLDRTTPPDLAVFSAYWGQLCGLGTG